MQFIEDSVFLKYIKSLGLSPSEYTGKNGKMVAAAKFKKTANEKKQGSRLMNLFSSSPMGLEIRGADEKETIETLGEKKANGKESEASQTVELTFVDETPVDTLPKQYSEMKSYVFRIVAPYSMKSQLDPLNAQTCIGLTFHSEQPSRSIDKMKLMIQGQGITSPYLYYNDLRSQTDKKGKYHSCSAGRYDLTYDKDCWLIFLNILKFYQCYIGFAVHPFQILYC